MFILHLVQVIIHALINVRFCEFHSFNIKNEMNHIKICRLIYLNIGVPSIFVGMPIFNTDKTILLDRLSYISLLCMSFEFCQYND